MCQHCDWDSDEPLRTFWQVVMFDPLWRWRQQVRIEVRECVDSWRRSHWFEYASKAVEHFVLEHIVRDQRVLADMVREFARSRTDLAYAAAARLRDSELAAAVVHCLGGESEDGMTQERDHAFGLLLQHVVDSRTLGDLAGNAYITHEQRWSARQRFQEVTGRPFPREEGEVTRWGR